jgi:hypothetical protein
MPKRRIAIFLATSLIVLMLLAVPGTRMASSYGFPVGVRARGAASSQQAPNGLVPPDPYAVIMHYYPSNTQPGIPVRTVNERTWIQRLVLDLDALPKVHGKLWTFSCPLYYGRGYHLRFLYRDKPPSHVHVDLSGCQWAYHSPLPRAQHNHVYLVSDGLRRDLPRAMVVGTTGK